MYQGGSCQKNYEIASTFVKVMQKKLALFFSGHGVYIHGPFSLSHCIYRL